MQHVNLIFESLGRMSMGIEYTFYKAANNTVKPAKIIVVPPYQDGDKGVLVEKYIMGAILIIFILLLKMAK